MIIIDIIYMYMILVDCCNIVTLWWCPPMAGGTRPSLTGARGASAGAGALEGEGGGQRHLGGCGEPGACHTTPDSMISSDEDIMLTQEGGKFSFFLFFFGLWGARCDSVLQAR